MLAGRSYPRPAPAAAPADEKVCPRCAETVQATAIVCRFCGHEFDAADPTRKVE
jgi:hypothetical protein